MRTGIIFDLDGTLLDTLEDLKDAVNHTLLEFGCPVRSLEEVRTFVGTGARNLIRKALPGKENDPPVEQVLQAYQVYYADHAQVKTAPYDGVLEALKQIAAKYPIAIVSNKPDIAVKLLCRDYFGEEVYALGETDDCPRKPAPDMVYKAMRAIGVEQCVYVGDSETDVETARNVGAKCLSVLWGFRDRQCLTQAGAEYFCEDPAKLMETLETMI